MSVNVFGAGVGRTGTYSLKLALNHLGLGPCHHMEEVAHNLPTQVPLWTEALHGRANWEAIYSGYRAAVDWRTAGFFRELIAAYPSAKFVLTRRNPQSWADSFEATIYKLLAEKTVAPPELTAWIEMTRGVVAKTGFPGDLDHDALIARFEAHCAAVTRTIPARQLLIYEVKEGWGPLCGFLDVPVPTESFPRTNDRTEFWDRIAKAI